MVQRCCIDSFIIIDKVDLDNSMNEFHIQLEDVLHAYISLVNELVRHLKWVLRASLNIYTIVEISYQCCDSRWLQAAIAIVILPRTIERRFPVIES